MVEAKFAFLICSQELNTKSGIIQKEVKRLLELAEQKPNEYKFLIPIRINEADIPMQLKRFQYIDHEERSYIQEIVKVIESIAVREEDKSLQKRISKYRETSGTTSDTVFSKLKRESKFHLYEADYFLYQMADEYFTYVNSEILTRVYKDYFRAFSSAEIKGEFFELHGVKYETSIFVNERYRKHDFISLGIGWSDSGGAHANHSYTTLNFGGRSLGCIKLDEIFDFGDSGKYKLLKWCADTMQLQDKIIGGAEVHEDDDYYENLFELGEERDYFREAELLSQFGFSNDGIEFNFGTGSGIPHAFGEREVKISWHQINFPLAEGIAETEFGKWIKKLGV